MNYGIDPIQNNNSTTACEVSQTLTCAHGRAGGGVLMRFTEAIMGQVGATIRNGNNWWTEVSMTLQTARGDNAPHVIVREVRA